MVESELNVELDAEKDTNAVLDMVYDFYYGDFSGLGVGWRYGYLEVMKFIANQKKYFESNKQPGYSFCRTGTDLYSIRDLIKKGNLTSWSRCEINYH